MKLHSIILSTMLSTTLFAGEPFKIYSLEELMNMTITSSTGTEQRISDAPSIASVITAKQIERSSARTLSEVLQMVPGMQIYLSPLNIQNDSYDIRGIKTGWNSQVLTLINGVSLDRASSGARLQRFNFPASAIKKVEIIRGPGSAVYGADAFSGVVNIITKDASYLQDFSQSGIRYGRYNRAEIYGNYGEIYKSGLELGINLSYMTSNGDRGRTIEADLQTTLDGVFGTSASKAPGSYDDRYDVYNMNLNMKYENLSMNLWAYISKDMGIGVGVGAANILDPKGKTENNQFIADLNYDSEPLQDIKWNNKLVLSYIDATTDFNIFPEGVVLPIGDDGNAFTAGGGIVAFPNGYIGNPYSEEKKIAYESTFNISKFENQNIRVSLGYSYVKLTTSETKNFGPGVIDGTVSPIDNTLTDVTKTSFIYLPDSDRKIFFLSLQDEYSFNDKWHLTAGIRYDNYSDFGDTINPRVGLVWNTSNELTTKLLYGRAFRAPGFSELYNKNNPAALGNKDLDPETIDMIELGARYSPNSKFTSSINLYWYKIDDLISGIPSIAGITQQNVGEQDGTRVNLSAYG